MLCFTDKVRRIGVVLPSSSSSTLPMWVNASHGSQGNACSDPFCDTPAVPGLNMMGRGRVRLQDVVHTVY